MDITSAVIFPGMIVVLGFAFFLLSLDSVQSPIERRSDASNGWFISERTSTSILNRHVSEAMSSQRQDSMSPVENSTDATKSRPSANSLGRRVLLAVVWGVLGALIGYEAGFNYGVRVWPTLQANSPDDYAARKFIVEFRAGCAVLAGLMAGALFGGLACYAPRVSASWLKVVGGIAVAGFVMTAISAGLGWGQFAGWAWFTTCCAAVVFPFLAAFFQTRRI